MAINDQMEMAFSGPAPRVDPVSGNEVPPGSLPEEVRDDIDVKLSEGEYVVPADVLRFHGVKFFEDLRAEAKMGLAGMDSAGRIGGQPSADAPMDPAAMGISDDDVAMLEKALSEGVPEAAMAKGGLMDKVVFAAMNDPLVNERINSKGMAVGFAEGGMTQSLYSDPTRIDSLIDKVMSAAQNNPALLGELSKRGVTVNTTKADMKPAEMQQANTQPVGLAEGGPLINAPLGFSGDMGTAPSISSGGTAFNPFEYGLGFSSFGKTTPAGYTPAVVAPTVAGGALGLAAPAPADPYAGQRGGVAVGQMMPNGKTRMPDEYYMGGGRSDEKRTMAALEASRADNADLKKYSYDDPEKLFSETMADATGENNPIEDLLGATRAGSIFAAGENVNLNVNIARLKRGGFDEDRIAELQKKVDAKKLAELGAKPGFLARGILGLGKAMAASQAKRIDDLFPIVDDDSSSSSASSDAGKAAAEKARIKREKEAAETAAAAAAVNTADPGRAPATTPQRQGKSSAERLDDAKQQSAAAAKQTSAAGVEKYNEDVASTNKGGTTAGGADLDSAFKDTVGVISNLNKGGLMIKKK